VMKVQRHNLAQSPAAFVENETVKAALNEKGESALPLLLLNGRTLAGGHYPERSALAQALGLKPSAASLFTPAVGELVAIGAAIAANCEPCLKYHYQQAQHLGVSKADMASAIKMAANVKDSPHQAILRLADRLTGAGLGNPATASDPCCGDKAKSDTTAGVSQNKTSCCG